MAILHGKEGLLCDGCYVFVEHGLFNSYYPMVAGIFSFSYIVSESPPCYENIQTSPNSNNLQTKK